MVFYGLLPGGVSGCPHGNTPVGKRSRLARQVTPFRTAKKQKAYLRCLTCGANSHHTACCRSGQRFIELIDLSN